MELPLGKWENIKTSTLGGGIGNAKMKAHGVEAVFITDHLINGTSLKAVQGQRRKTGNVKRNLPNVRWCGKGCGLLASAAIGWSVMERRMLFRVKVGKGLTKRRRF